MLLYKFRSLQGDGLAQALDMVLKERIYLSTYDKMNDPHEGGFDIARLILQSKNDGSREKYLEDAHKVRELIQHTRFTCFTNFVVEPLLWAHYAGGYSGVAFEYEIPDTLEGFDLLPISYTGVVPPLTGENFTDIISGKTKFYELGVLRTKKKEWAYEKEYRLYSKKKATYLEGIKPSGIIFSGVTSMSNDVFTEVCRRLGMRIGHLLPSMAGDVNYYLFFPDDPDKDDSEHIDGGWVGDMPK